jgi:hypothetical protein
MSTVEIETEPELPVSETTSTTAAASNAADGTVTLSEVYAQLQSDALQAQALAARAGPKMESCSYALGPHSQPVYWCKTCHANKQVGGA